MGLLNFLGEIMSRIMTSCTKNKDDYISNIPDDVIINILSRLPTKYAVRTSVLSKVWKYKWTSISEIDISQEESLVEEDRWLTFANFVDRVLSNAQNVKHFRFRFYSAAIEEYEKDRIETWMSTVFSRNVEVVSVEIHDSIILPGSLLTCTSLRELDLFMACSWKISVSNYFPNLTRIYLMEVEIKNENSNCDTLMFHFPVLQSFEVIFTKWLNVRLVELYAPALISFFSVNAGGKEIDSYIIKIVGASLQNFETCGCYLENFLLTGSTVSHASLTIDDHGDETIVKSGLHIRRLLKEFSSLKSLELTYYLARALARTKSGPPLYRCDRLRRLALSSGEELSFSRGNIDGLFELLHSAPVLRSLAIEMFSAPFIDSMDYYDSYMMKPVPSCVVSYLEEVKLDWLSDEIHELHLAKYFLKNGAQLKKLAIHGVGGEKDVVAEQLSKFPKASACLTIVIM